MVDEYITSDGINEKLVNTELKKILEFIDYSAFNKIINKLTDYAEILSEGKISGIVNFNYRLNSTQTNQAIELLVNIQALSRIYNLALKGSKDLEEEYISNIFSDVENTENLSSYISLRNILENRLNNQTQQYNMNMGKANTTMSMPLNELRGHAKTHVDLTESNLTVSTKAQHGIIAASLHDAYTIILNRSEFWVNRSYMKYFFNEDDIEKRKILILTKTRRLSLREIKDNVHKVMDLFSALTYTSSSKEAEGGDSLGDGLMQQTAIPKKGETFVDRMLLTPFGRQYGSKIDSILNGIFAEKDSMAVSGDELTEKLRRYFEFFKTTPDLNRFATDIADIADYLVLQDYSIKVFAEKYLYHDKKESFNKFFTPRSKAVIEDFLTHVFTIYFESRFESLFKIIKSLDLKKFACAFIMKRIYLKEGENLTNLGYFFIRVIAKVGGIKV